MVRAFRLPNRVVVRLRGAGALKFVHDVSTQDVLDLQPGESRLTAFLTDKGRLLADARIIVLDDQVLLDAEEVAGPGLRTALSAAPLAGITIDNEPPWGHIFVTGDVEALIRSGMPLAQAPGSAAVWGDVVCVAGSWGEDGWSLLCHHLTGVVDRIDGAGIEWGVPDELEEVRIAAGRPRFGTDVASDTLINETPLLRHAISFTKGCYPGQESVARIQNLGRVKRLLRVLEVSRPVAVGVPVLAGGEPVGAVTSAAGKHALAWISGDVEPGSFLDAGGADVSVTDAGWS